MQQHRTYRRIAIGEDAPDAVTVAIERRADGQLVAAVWWPATRDIDPNEAMYENVTEAFAAAEAARALHDLSEIVVTLQDDNLWRPAWGTLSPQGPDLSADEVLELARATEASRDA